MNAKLARLASLDPGDLTVSEWRSASTLLVMSLHDTMNHTARSDGAICMERQPVDRLPNVVALSNHGGPDAGIRASTTGALLDDEDVLSLDPATMRAIANAYRWAFDAYGPDDVAFNRPYLGGFETRHIAPWLRSRPRRPSSAATAFPSPCTSARGRTSSSVSSCSDPMRPIT